MICLERSTATSPLRMYAWAARWLCQRPYNKMSLSGIPCRDSSEAPDLRKVCVWSNGDRKLPKARPISAPNGVLKSRKWRTCHAVDVLVGNALKNCSPNEPLRNWSKWPCAPSHLLSVLNTESQTALVKPDHRSARSKPLWCEAIQRKPKALPDSIEDGPRLGSAPPLPGATLVALQAPA